MAEPGFANAHGIRKHGLKHRLQLAGRVRDDAQYLRGRRLSFQSRGQLERARLHLLKEPSIFDGDDCLSRESLKQRNLVRSKWVHLEPSQHNRADRLMGLQKWYGEYGAMTYLGRNGRALGELIDFSPKVRDVHGLRVHDSPPHHIPPS